MPKQWICLFFLLFYASRSMALDIGSRLTIRILKTTDSKKTVLVNKGRDEGLILGDHAKLFISEGVVARAVVIELSKQRSVWSIYRVVNPDLIAADEVMNLKITPKAKLSDDPLAVVSKDATFSESIDDQLKNKEFAVYSDLIDDTKAPGEKVLVEEATRDFSKDISGKTFELWALLGFQSFSSEVSTANTDYSASEFFNQIIAGFEYYFRRISLIGYFQLDQESLLSYDGAITDSVLFEYGGGLNFYIFGDPHKSRNFISYLTLGAGLGSVTDSFAGGDLSGPSAADSVEATGSSFAMWGGVGFKYYLDSGFGMRLILDAYRRKDTFDEVAGNSTEGWDRTKFGPRLMLGLSYRF